MLEREPSLVCETITGELAEVALIGVYLVILGFELDPPELVLVRRILEIIIHYKARSTRLRLTFDN